MTIREAFQIALQHHQAGRLAEAEALYHQILAMQPDHADALHLLGVIAQQAGHNEVAVELIRKAIFLNPNNPDAYSNLGVGCRMIGLLDESIAAYRRALEIKPDYAEAHINLGSALSAQGEFDEAIAAYRRALDLQPEHAWVQSSLIYTLLFHPDHIDKTITEERMRWNRHFGDPLKRFVLPHGNDRSPERVLRVGYVSPDFRDHVTGRYLAPLFEYHDSRNFEILCYAGVERPDKMTEAFRRHARQWRSSVGVSDEALAEMVRRDDVDILVDLTQHMAGNRLPMFAREPAPVQVSFAGYPGSTGLDAIRYRISDQYLEGESVDEGAGGDEHVCMIDSFWCYDPCGVEVKVNPLPALESGAVTFGCLNNFCKVNERVLNLWARVLGTMTDSRLIILSGAGVHRQRTLETFKREGVDGCRVEFVEARPRQDYLELYHRLDIALDPFPYNGHTTSLDALWMGVPVVSLAGKTPVSRAGLSQLTNLGLPELVAHAEQDFVRIAVELARDLPRLAGLRSTLRKRMQASILMDAPRFTRQVEQAYRAMWRAWCAGHSPISEKI